MLKIGDKAPDFELQDQDGNVHKLSDYKGKKFILYFYPKDNTSGCTKEACAYSLNYPHFKEKGVEVIGVSKDSVKSHKNFQTKFDLQFNLLSDESCKMLEAYDVYKEKSMYGRKYMGIVRTTYLIDEEGVIIKANDKVKAAEDADLMLKEI
ncbi:MAG: thioredoxin-dependent thiol peroxidase [Erysipelotrichaceae bacterium]|nr:thioredoxin-dependent thiol peroxidase [Erysipelotrichaceae bacterium]